MEDAKETFFYQNWSIQGFSNGIDTMEEKYIPFKNQEFFKLYIKNNYLTRS